MKNIWLKSAFMAVAVFSTVSCGDFLELTPEDLIVEDNYWDEQNDVEQVLIGCYTRMQDHDFLARAFVWGEVRADNVSVGNCKAGEAEYEILQENILSTNTYTSWTPFYAVINRCNLVIDRAPKVAEIDPDYTESEVRATIAEATGLRALCYFYLVRTFKDVPYYTYAITSDDQTLTLPVTDGNKIMDELIKDLEEIQGNAPLKFLNGGTDVTCGRMSRIAVWALLADLNLWRGNYDKAIAYADQVIDYKNRFNPNSDLYDPATSSSISSSSSRVFLRNQYFAGIETDGEGNDREKLVYFPILDDAAIGNVAGVFGRAYGYIFGSGLSEESIFELSFDGKYNSNNTKNNDMIDDFFRRYIKRNNIDPANGKFSAAQAFVEQFNLSTAGNIFLAWNNDVAETTLSTPDARLLESISFGMTEKGMASSGELVKYNWESNYVSSKPVQKSYYLGNMLGRTTEKNDANWIFYRVSDMMLIKAEALVNAHHDDANCMREAFDLVRAINDRSNTERMINTANYTKLKIENYRSEEAMYQLVMDERRREFLFEGKRWFDLVRWSRKTGTTEKLKEACTSKMTQGATSGSGKLTNMNAIYFPYNKTELQTNPNLQQNPAYPEVDSDSYESTKQQ